MQNSLLRGIEHKNALAWTLGNNMVNENGEPFEYNDHRFMIQPLTDDVPDLVAMKSAQVGFSVEAIKKSLHKTGYDGFNTIYVLPTRTVVKDFVTPKVDPIIRRNSFIADMVGEDRVDLKKVGDRFIYFRGAFSEREAISITADLVIADEYDRSDQAVLNTYQSRLQASKHGWYWKFSNPSVPNFGVHELYEGSDQQHWFVTCQHCGHEWYMAWEKDNYEKNHYVEQEAAIYACGKCHKELNDDARRNGRWVAKYPGRSRRGYWISQLFMPWVAAAKIIEQYRGSSPEFFNNFVLGLPYIAAEYLIDRGAIVGIATPTVPEMSQLVLGVDNGVEKHWVLGNMRGIISHGVTKDWAEIERMLVDYNALAVIDPNPYPDIPKKLVKKYRGRVFICYYSEDKKSPAAVRFEERNKAGVVNADRTQIFDQVAAEITNKEFILFDTERGLEGYINHWGNMYRAIEVNARGQEKGVWETKPNKPDHWAHCTVYWRIGTMRLQGIGSSGIVAPRQGVLIDNTQPGYTPNIDIKKIAKGSNKPTRGEWRKNAKRR